MRWSAVSLTVLCVCLPVHVLSNILDQKLSRQDVLNHLLNTSHYDSRIAPNFEQDTATNVTIQLFIRSIHSIRELSMDFSVDIFLRQKWTDSRLAFTNMTNISRLELDQKLIEKVWVPDTIFTNEKEAAVHSITVPNKLMHLYQNGTVYYSARIGMTLNCHMELQKYPLDTQFCPFYLESYGYTTDNLIFHWDTERALELTDVELPQFFIDAEPYFNSCNKNYGTGVFTCLEAGVQLKRNTGYYIIQVFVPSILIVILSWVSFWIDIDSTPARISLGVLTVLTMTTQSAGARAQLPRVSYVKAIDVWMATCLFFVFAALIEFAYANVTFRGKKSSNAPIPNIPEEGAVHATSKSYVRVLKKSEDPKRRGRYVDKISRILFPASFIIFNIVFWLYYSFAPDGNPRIV